MNQIADINYEEIEKNEEYEELIKEITEQCFKEEKLDKTDLYLSITLSNEEYIHKINKETRNVDKPTDVLSFPMFEKNEIPKTKTGIPDVLGDIIICIPIVKKQAIEYEHSFKRELAYMLVHGFYHLMGYDHIEEKDKQKMREKEENILSKLNIID
ncbi:MAG: rRNA maturation RNase YbeY [Clostridia bacterium]|nr:rRNA maturation RNase YbeY [Clostridia bacterium]